MADVYTDVATQENTPGGPANALDPQLTRGKDRRITAIYTAASLATGSVIRICKLRTGDYVEMDSWIMHADCGSGVLCQVGDDDDTTAVDANRYLEDTELSPTGVIQFNDVATCIAKVPYKIQKDCWLEATITNEATGRIIFGIHITPAGA
jgi:hypothetical protein